MSASVPHDRPTSTVAATRDLWGKGTQGREGTSPTEEITFDLFGAIEDFNDALTSGDSTEKVRVEVRR